MPPEEVDLEIKLVSDFLKLVETTWDLEIPRDCLTEIERGRALAMFLGNGEEL